MKDKNKKIGYRLVIPLHIENTSVGGTYNL
jgi:hypothetical protein